MTDTTNALESLNMQLRKVLKNRGHFPSAAAAGKLVYLAWRQNRGAVEKALDACGGGGAAVGVEVWRTV